MTQKISRKPDSFIDTFNSPIGELYLVFSGERLAAIEFEKPLNVLPMGSSKQSALFKNELDAYFHGHLKEFGKEIELCECTDFERQVWRCLEKIPYGETRTYKWIAEQIGKPKAMRAVGQALAKNPIPIVLPCHRVIQSDGSLGGYSGGIDIKDIKRRLLNLEYYYAQSVGNSS